MRRQRGYSARLVLGMEGVGRGLGMTFLGWLFGRDVRKIKQIRLRCT